MQEVYSGLADRLAQVAAALPRGKKYIIGIAGAPGSGKSTTAAAVCSMLNQRCAAAGLGQDCAVVVPMDGFHYYRSQLDKMPDPKEAYARRGAHWTFDAKAFVECIRQLRGDGDVLVPSFDHAVGDPVEGDIKVTGDNMVVMVEGNYLLLEEGPWVELRSLLDEAWYVDCCLEEAMGRVFQRQTGIGLTPDESRQRIAGNDRPNAELIARTKGRASLLVPSLPFHDA